MEESTFPPMEDESLFIEYITKEWNVFMTTDKTEDVSPSLLWETAKAYLRGSIISYTTAQKKASMKEQLDLEHIIQNLEVQFKISRSKTILKKLEAARSALNQLLTKRAKAAIFFAKHKLYESGNKPGCLLAKIAKDLWKLNLSPVIIKIKKDLDRWQKLPLSLMGCVNLIKMSILPRLLYPLQMLPVLITQKVSCDTEKAFSKFIWGGKKPRLRIGTLQLRVLWEWLHAYLNSYSHLDSWSTLPYSLWSLAVCDKKKNNITNGD
uniref:Uncharacterized protein n=1 Tax=Neolamprologus brichardi TaxID=32507 RepID=A0A3Q4M420_NEOBR